MTLCASVLLCVHVCGGVGSFTQVVVQDADGVEVTAPYEFNPWKFQFTDEQSPHQFVCSFRGNYGETPLVMPITECVMRVCVRICGV